MNPEEKILDFLCSHPDFDYHVSEIAEKAEVSRPTVYTVLKRLLESGRVIQTRNSGLKRYKINLKNKEIRKEARR